MRPLLSNMAGLIGGFFSWWFGELTALVPPPLRRLFAAGGERQLLSLAGRAARLYGLRGRRAQLLGESGDLESLAANRNGKALDVVLALPRDQVVTRKAELPLAAEENLREVLGFEMDRLTPFSRAEVYYDFTITGRDTKRGRLGLSVFLAPKQTVDALIDRAEAHGFTVKAVDISETDGDEVLGLNLLPTAPMRAPSPIGRAVAVAFTVAAVMLLLLAIEIPLQRKADYADAVSQRVVAERARVAALRKLEEEIAGLQRQGGSLEDLKHRDGLTLALLDKVTRLLPDDAWLVQLSLAGNRLELTGFSPASSTLLTSFEESPLFAETVFRAPVTQDPRVGRERFSLSMKVVPQERTP